MLAPLLSTMHGEVHEILTRQPLRLDTGFYLEIFWPHHLKRIILFTSESEKLMYGPVSPICLQSC